MREAESKYGAAKWIKKIWKKQAKSYTVRTEIVDIDFDFFYYNNKQRYNKTNRSIFINQMFKNNIVWK